MTEDEYGSGAADPAPLAAARQGRRSLGTDATKPEHAGRGGVAWAGGGVASASPHTGAEGGAALPAAVLRVFPHAVRLADSYPYP